MRSRLIIVALSLFFYGCSESISPDIRDPDSLAEALPSAISKFISSDHLPDKKQVSQTLNQKTVNVFDSSSAEYPEDAIILSVMGHVYHWSSHALLRDVRMNFDMALGEASTEESGSRTSGEMLSLQP